MLHAKIISSSQLWSSSWYSSAVLRLFSTLSLLNLLCWSMCSQPCINVCLSLMGFCSGHWRSLAKHRLPAMSYCTRTWIPKQSWELLANEAPHCHLVVGWAASGRWMTRERGQSERKERMHNETDVSEQIHKRWMQHISYDKRIISTLKVFHGWVVTLLAEGRDLKENWVWESE